MVKKLMLPMVALVALALVSPILIAQEEAKTGEKAAGHEFIGVKKCSFCHKKDGTFPSWEKTPHATAFASLKTDAEKADPTCLTCHATGKLATGEVLEGVQCESCHGAGGDYWKKSVMEDRELAIKNGMIIPTAETCKTCHEGKVPEGHKELPAFDFEKMKATGIHDMPVAEKTEG
ncbi:MAG: multiheme c-type cytochrome [candidate division Zixibacteria bacterium]|jgi:hypothetical protein|nr:multiheme c-type cytochrome [candidate division Zixibacteria bacterium]